MASSTSSAPTSFTGSAWLKIWKHVSIAIFCRLGVFSKVVIGVVKEF